MYNALVRKGGDIDPTAVESMVSVHNFLNEGAWAEIVEWERRFGRGLSKGWEMCKRGEEGSMAGANLEQGVNEGEVAQPKLIRFMGRPKDMTPKAAMIQLFGKIYPSGFGYTPFYSDFESQNADLHLGPNLHSIATIGLSRENTTGTRRK